MVRLTAQVMVPMRDGTRLATDLYLPGSSAGPWPAIVLRTPYGLGPDSSPHEAAQQLAAWGYAVVNQDVRGRYRSEGRFRIEGEGQDGSDTIAWVRAQPWCNGRVGMRGGSYLAWTQFAAARRHPPGLSCLFAAVGDRYWYGLELWGHGSALPQLLAQAWFLYVATEDPHVREDEAALAQLQTALAELPDLGPWHDDPQGTARSILDGVLDVPHWADTLPLRNWTALKPARDYFAYWTSGFDDPGLPPAPAPNDPHTIEVPVYLVGGWFDVFLQGTLANYQTLVANARGEDAARAHRLLIGPWGHGLRAADGLCGEINLGPDADLDLLALEQCWFGRWLQGVEREQLDEPRVRYYTMGVNRWRTCCKWPPGGSVYVPYYFHGPDDRDAPRANACGRLTRQRPRWDPPQQFVYDPHRPMPTRGGNVLGLPYGSYDQRPVTGEARDDVLSFTSDPLPEPLEVTGPLRVVLYAASSAVDTDFTAKLIDIQPNGRMLNVQDGIVRARYRHGHASSPALLVPGQVYRFEIDLSATSYVFLPGHRLRVDIASSNFPRFDRNANTGKPIGSDHREDLTSARQTIFHDASRPSHILLPVVTSIG